MAISYDRTTPSGLKTAEHVNAVLALIDEAATLKAIADELTKQPNHTSPAAGQDKQLLEVGLAGVAFEATVNQSFGSSPGNVGNGARYTGDVTGFVIEVDVQDDQGSQCHVRGRVISGTPLEDELMTADSPTNTGKITVGTLVWSGGDAFEGTKTGGGNGKYPGEEQFGVGAGSGAEFYDALVAAADGLTALRDEYVKLFQGG